MTSPIDAAIIKALVEHIGGDSNNSPDGGSSGTTVQNSFSVNDTILGLSDVIEFHNRKEKTFIYYKNTENKFVKLLFIDNSSPTSTYFLGTTGGFRVIDLNRDQHHFGLSDTTNHYECDFSNYPDYTPSTDQSEARVYTKNIESDFLSSDEIILVSLGSCVKLIENLTS